jgi:hypothetical protein
VRVGERKMENLCYDTIEKEPHMEFPYQLVADLVTHFR